MHLKDYPLATLLMNKSEFLEQPSPVPPQFQNRIKISEDNEIPKSINDVSTILSTLNFTSYFFSKMQTFGKTCTSSERETSSRLRIIDGRFFPQIWALRYSDDGPS